jgi:hypothetical protein
MTRPKGRKSATKCRIMVQWHTFVMLSVEGMIEVVAIIEQHQRKSRPGDEGTAQASASQVQRINELHPVHWLQVPNVRAQSILMFRFVFYPLDDLGHLFRR